MSAAKQPAENCAPRGSDASTRAAKREAASERRYVRVECEACGLPRYTAPVHTRWLRGLAVVLCHECWRSPTPDRATEIDNILERREESADAGSRRDRDELAIELAHAAWTAVETPQFIHCGLTLKTAQAEHERVVALARSHLPRRCYERALGAAMLRGEESLIDSPREEEDHFLAHERDAYARALFTGVCRAWDVAEEFHDWVFDSAAAGEWLTTSADPERGYRIEPRVGPYPDHARHSSPPSTTWGRHTKRCERGTGTWITSLNQERRWDKARHPPRFLELADERERELSVALADEIGERGLPRSSDASARFGIDREELKYRLHRRLCEWCRDSQGEEQPRPHGRKKHRFACTDISRNEADPRMSWIDDHLARPWNGELLFRGALRQLHRLDHET